MQVAIIGGGWAGMAAAVHLSLNGHQPTLFEASRHLGGRARNLELPDGTLVDNGQHILIGAYSDSLKLMRIVGVEPEQAMLRKPLTMAYADGRGLSFPDLPAPLDALIGIASNRGWSLRERAALLKRALHWRMKGFRCAGTATVAHICSDLPKRLLDEFIEPLCISALNLPADQASGSLFLRVLHDALFAGTGGSHFLVPRCGLSDLFPTPAAQWLQSRGHAVHTACRIQALIPHDRKWLVRSTNSADSERSEASLFNAVLLACPPQEAARLVLHISESKCIPASDSARCQRWAQTAQQLEHTAIATVYARTNHRLASDRPWLALPSSENSPAQFVFDRGHLHSADQAQQGLMAFVISHCHTDREIIERDVLAQARQQLGWMDIQAVKTVVEKRATFACKPRINRPGIALSHGIWACGDYVVGPYPATLEGAVRSGLQAANTLVRTDQN